MSFFELDGGAKKKAKKSTKPKAKTTKKAPVKKSSGKKTKTKKGGNFLGTVSELFAPAGWENFVTAAGLLALDRTDNYLRKSKDSKKQRGGVDDIPKMEEEMTGGARKRSSSRKHRGGADDIPKMEEEMTGGARKRSSSRKQRGGSDGHHTIEALDAMMGGEEPEMTAQTGGAKSKSKSRSSSRSKKVKKTVKKVRKVRNHKGGAMNEEQQNALYEAYLNSNSQNKNSQNATTYDSFIANLLTQLGVEVNDTNVEEAKLVIDYKKKPNGNQSKVNAKNRLNAFISSQTSPLAQNKNSLFGNSLREANTEPIPIPGTSGLSNNRLGSNTSTYLNNSAPTSNANASLQFGPMSPNAPQSGGGKPKSKSKSSSKKPKSKAKKPKTKSKKPKTKGRK